MSSTETQSLNYYVTTFYKFQTLANPEQVKIDLEAKAESLRVKGLIIIGTEGFNATVSCPVAEGFAEFKQFIRDYFQQPELFFKDSESPKAPFRRFKVKIREEIVTLGTPELIPDYQKNHHLSPAEWNKVMKEENDFLLVDTRNWYETKIGTFKGAVNPGIDKFTEFPEYVEKHQIPKDKKMLIFCTGGIRCEKGILELQRQGFDNVYQLDGGIINYLQEFPNDQYEGECFVFDHRVALDQDLKPTTKYGLCPHCGQPSSKTVECKRCDTHELICEDCADIEWKKDTCSKNCAYQFELHPQKKAPRQVMPFEIEKERELGNLLT
jgi:UPF0176 protein